MSTGEDFTDRIDDSISHCPLCASQGRLGSLAEYAISLEDSIIMCNNEYVCICTICVLYIVIYLIFYKCMHVVCVVMICFAVQLLHSHS